jgi:hypothetical protein
MGWTFPPPQPNREVLRVRFLNVIALAGYKGEAPERICEEWFEKLMQDVPNFIKMMEEYERSNGDPD